MSTITVPVDSVPVRFTMASLFGLAMALAMFSGLWRLVQPPLILDAPPRAIDVQYGRMRIDTPPRMSTPAKKPPRPEYNDVPRAPAGPGRDGPVDLRPPVVPPEAPPGRNPASSWGADGAAVQLIGMAPEYPYGAVTRGTEGWVIVEFTVSASGAVKDAFVVDSHPKRAFDSAALRAVLGWRFRPKVEAGDAIEQTGVRRKFTFTFEG
jgi:protein TonB